MPVKRTRAQTWTRRMLFGAAACFALSSFVLWAASIWGSLDPQRWSAPIAPGRSIHIEVWPIVFADTPCDLYQPDCRRFHDPPPGGRWLNIWYQDRATQTLRRLAVLTLPAWPLLGSGAGAALAVPLVHILLRATWKRHVLAFGPTAIIRAFRNYPPSLSATLFQRALAPLDPPLTGLCYKEATVEKQ